jgi:transcriptional antiterminator RfaH
VQILQGPFAGLTGVYRMQLAESRALLLIELLGRHNEVQVDLHAIAATA